MTVYVTESHSQVYHSNEDCYRLQESNGILEKEKDVLGWKEECSLCQGIEPGRNSPAHERRNLLLETDPDDIGGSA